MRYLYLYLSRSHSCAFIFFIFIVVLLYCYPYNHVMPIKMSDLKKVLNKGKNPMPARDAIAEQLNELPSSEPLLFGFKSESGAFLLRNEVEDCVDRCWVDDPQDWRNQIITRESVNREIAKVSAAMEKAWQNGSDNVVKMLLQEHAKLRQLDVSLMSPAEKREYQHECDLYDSARKGEL